MNELKPCPFCGGEAQISSDTEATRDTADRFWAYTIVCSRCCATSGLTYTPKKAVEAWNRRASDTKCDFYDKEEIFPNCTVQVLTNTVTGEVSVGWWKNDRT